MLLKYNGSHNQFFGCCIKGLTFDRNSLFVSCQLLWAKSVWYFTGFQSEMVDEQCQIEAGRSPKNCGRTSQKKKITNSPSSCSYPSLQGLLNITQSYFKCLKPQIQTASAAPQCSFVYQFNFILLCLVNSCCSIQHLLGPLATSLFQDVHLPGFELQLIFIQQRKQL